MAKKPLELIQGTLDMLVLKSLAGGAKHGYGVMRWLRDASGDQLQIEEGALYPALHRMDAKGLVQAEWGLSENNRQAKFYSITPKGRSRLETATEGWARYVSVIGKILGTTA